MKNEATGARNCFLEGSGEVLGGSFGGQRVAQSAPEALRGGSWDVVGGSGAGLGALWGAAWARFGAIFLPEEEGGPGEGPGGHF